VSFGRLEKPARQEPMSEINVTPLVDVMLVLLVIFIIAAPLMSSRLELELPKTGESVAPVVEPEAFVAVSVDAKGQVYWSDEPIDLAELQRRLAQAAQRNTDTEVQLRADTAVPYGRVVQLIGLAQSAGLARIGFITDAMPGAPAASSR
jgi:biopolymer transport protein TolR